MDNLNDGEPGHVVAPKKVAHLASALAVRVSKDAIPNNTVAKSLAVLAKRVANSGKELHIILAGCNTIGLVSPLHKATVPAWCKRLVSASCTRRYAACAVKLSLNFFIFWPASSSDIPEKSMAKMRRVTR